MTSEGFVFAWSLVDLDASTTANQEATVSLALLWKVFVSSSPVKTVLFTKLKIIWSGSAFTARLSLLLFGLWSCAAVPQQRVLLALSCFLNNARSASGLAPVGDLPFNC